MRRFAALLIGAGILVLPAPASADDATYLLGFERDYYSVDDTPAAVLAAKDPSHEPASGLAVRFVRTGPGAEFGESCSAAELSQCGHTDVAGVARYEFVGGAFGHASVMAEIYGADGQLLYVAGPSSTRIGIIVDPFIVAELAGESQGPKDVLRLDASSNADGARVRLLRRVAEGWEQIGKAGNLDQSGNHRFTVIDRNGSKKTTYRALVGGTVDSRADVTNEARVR